MMLANADDQNVLLESFDFSSTQETGENLEIALKNAIELAKERYDAEIYAALSDNAANVVNMGDRAQKMGLIFSTCNSHTANLLAGDILKVVANSKTMEKVMSVQKEFRKTSLSDLLSKAGGNKAVLSCTTRWSSQRDAFQSFKKNLTAMKKFAADCDIDAENNKKAIKPSSHVVQLLFNENFVVSVDHLIDKLNPVSELINKC